MKSTNNEILAALREAYPQLFSTRDEDGETVERIDLEKIRLLAGEGNYCDRYGLRWENKPERFDVESAGKLPSLKLVPDKRIQSDPTKPNHILIQGDNYHALKVLAYTHERSVDVIYIDPPYNTGNKDFKYNDRFVDKEDGYRHSKWLSFMAKRLKLAKTLLKDSGVIFISIDDNEQAALTLLCDEVFGEPSRVATFAWRKTDNQANIGQVARVKEYVLCYSKLPGKHSFGKVPLSDKAKAEYRYEDEGGYFRRDILFHKTRGRHTYPVTTPQGTTLTGPWMVKENEFLRMAAANEIYWADTGMPYGKLYLTNSKGQIPSDWLGTEVGTNQRGSLELEAVLSERKFSFPKPSSLIQYLLSFSAAPDALVVDFFAGSGTTAHAVMQLNAEDGGTRQCILVTNDEGEFKDDSGTVLPGGICTHVTYPRLKKVIEGYMTPKGKAVAGLGENLEFFETSFVPVPQSRNQLQSFVRYSASLLQLKAGCFTEVEQTAQWSLFTDGKKHLFLLFDSCSVEEALVRLKSVEGPVVAHVFAYDSDDDSAEILGGLPDVTVQEVPQPLLDLFFRLKE